MKRQVCATNSFENSTWKLFELGDKVARLEGKVFPNKREKTTLNQQILLMYNLGMLDPLLALNISNVKKAELLSIILNSDKSNTKKAIEAISKKENSILKTPANYEFIREVFTNFELHELAEKANSVLSDIEKRKSKAK